MIESTGRPLIPTTQPVQAPAAQPATNELPREETVQPTAHDSNEIQEHSTYAFENEVSFGEMIQGISKAAVALFAPSRTLSVLADPQLTLRETPSQPERPEPVVPPPQPTEPEFPREDTEDEVQYI